MRTDIVRTNTINVLDQVKIAGLASIDFAGGRFQHENPFPRSDRSLTLDLASPLYYPSSLSMIYDRGPYGNHGTISGATWKKLPSGLRYLDFDGIDDYVDCGKAESLRPTTAITLKAWIKNESAGNTELINYRLTGAGGSIYSILRTGATIQLADGAAFGVLEVSSFNAALPIDIWTHVVLTWSRGTQQLKSYINKVLQADVEATGNFDLFRIAAGAKDNLWLGAAHNTLRHADCSIVLVELHSDIMWSESDIVDNFNREKDLIGI